MDKVIGLRGLIPADVRLRMIEATGLQMAILVGMAGPLGEGVIVIFEDGRETFDGYMALLRGTVNIPEGVSTEQLLTAVRARGYEPIVVSSQTDEHRAFLKQQSNAYWNDVRAGRVGDD